VPIHKGERSLVDCTICSQLRRFVFPCSTLRSFVAAVHQRDPFATLNFTVRLQTDFRFRTGRGRGRFGVVLLCRSSTPIVSSGHDRQSAVLRSWSCANCGDRCLLLGGLVGTLATAAVRKRASHSTINTLHTPKHIHSGVVSFKTRNPAVARIADRTGCQ